MDFLIVGGRSEAGQSALTAILEFDPSARIFATSSKSDGVAGAELIPNIDLNDSAAAEKIAAALGDVELWALFFTPAFGPIGYPIRDASAEDARAALAFSFDPMKALADRLRPQMTVGYSAFYWLPHTRAAYGAMAFAKIALDRLCFREPERFRAVRAGTFLSQATRGIGLLLQRKLRDTPHAEIRDLGERWRASGKKFGEFFFEYAFENERAAFGSRFTTPHRATTGEDLRRITLKLLRNEITAPVASVIGDWTWSEAEAPVLDSDFKLADQLQL